MASMPVPGTFRRILIIRLGAIGDILLTTPVIRILKTRYPECRIDFLTKEAYIPLLKSHPGLNRVLAFQTGGGLRELLNVLRTVRRERYDAVADLQNNFRSRIMEVFSGAHQRSVFHPGRVKRFLLVHFRRNLYRTIQPVPLKYLRSVRALGIEDDGGGLDFFIKPAARESLNGRIGAMGLRIKEPILALAPGAGRATKRWPADRFAGVGLHFLRKGYQIVVLGGQDDADSCKSVLDRMDGSAVSFCGTLMLSETAAFLERIALLVTNDTGVMHMASALKVKTVAIFGPTTRHFGFFPFRSSSTVVEANLGCRPCSYHGTERCPERHFKCMLDISSAEASGAAERILGSE
jgi:heptosyltransferase-2